MARSPMVRVSAPKLSGVYVPTFGLPVTDPTLQPMLANLSVDGFFVVRNWKDVESTAGVYDFETKLGGDLRMIAAAHKHATVAIAAGINAPADVCQSSGAACLDLAACSAAPTPRRPAARVVV